jgi:hypothetical protein
MLYMHYALHEAGRRGATDTLAILGGGRGNGNLATFKRGALAFHALAPCHPTSWCTRLVGQGREAKGREEGRFSFGARGFIGDRRDPNPAQSQSHLLAASPKETFIGERGHRATGEHFALRTRHGAWDLLNPSRRRCELSHLKKTPLRIV